VPEEPSWRRGGGSSPPGRTRPTAPDCRRFRRDGWRAEIAVLHSPWTGRLFIRVLRGEVSLDDNPVAAGRFHPLEPGAILRDAGGQAVYRCEIERLFGAPPAAAPIRFEAERSSIAFPGGETGIRDFSFRETGGRLVGVMGGSGTGQVHAGPAAQRQPAARSGRVVSTASISTGIRRAGRRPSARCPRTTCSSKT
jgi:hypothetical protein